MSSKTDSIIEPLYREVPSGVGSESSKLRVNDAVLTEVFNHGARWAVENGYGVKADLEHCEENGEMKGADASRVSQKARARGKPQLGTWEAVTISSRSRSSKRSTTMPPRRRSGWRKARSRS